MNIEQGVLFLCSSRLDKSLVERVEEQADSIEKVGHAWPPLFRPDFLEGGHEVGDGLIPRQSHACVQWVHGHREAGICHVEQQDILGARRRHKLEHVQDEIAMRIGHKHARLWGGRTRCWSQWLHGRLGEELDQHRFARTRHSREERVREQHVERQVDGHAVAAML